MQGEKDFSTAAGTGYKDREKISFGIRMSGTQWMYTCRRFRKYLQIAANQSGHDTIQEAFYFFLS